LGTQIDLPGVDAEIEPQVRYGSKDIISRELEMPDTPANPGLVATPLLPYAGEKLVERDCRGLDNPEMSVEQGVGATNLRSPRNVILAEFNRVMEEIDVSTLSRRN